MLVVRQVLPRQENENSGYEELDQDCVQLKLSNMKSHTHEIKNDFVKFYHHVNLQLKSSFCNISAKGSCPDCNAGSNGC